VAQKQNVSHGQQETSISRLLISNMVCNVSETTWKHRLDIFVDDTFSISEAIKSRTTLEVKIRRKIVIEKLKTFIYEEDGLTIVEYAVAAGLITALVAGAFTALGVSVENVITTVTGYLPPVP